MKKAIRKKRALRKARRTHKIKTKFGIHLHDLRIRRGLSLAKLGGVSGNTIAAISMWERGQTQPTLTAILGLCKALKVSPNVLIGKLWSRPR